ncbi:hypothetical protein GBP346_B2871 [Burkholderia pseudomallei MSHR346]|nr:hypothetical protein GBP346_B2871 [Burkholderia pseudomallei MSHR346]
MPGMTGCSDGAECMLSPRGGWGRLRDMSTKHMNFFCAP